MKKLIVALGLIAVLVPAAAYPEQGKIAGFVDKLLGKGKDEPATGQPAPSRKKIKYIIRLRSGGKIETDNYEIMKDSVRIMLPAGAILLQKSEIKEIQEVVADENATVQKNFPLPAKGADVQRAPERRDEHLVAPPAPSFHTRLRITTATTSTGGRGGLRNGRRNTTKRRRITRPRATTGTAITACSWA